MNSESTATNEAAVPTTNGDSGSHVTVDNATAGLIVTRKRSKSTEAGVYDSLVQGYDNWLCSNSLLSVSANPNGLMVMKLFHMSMGK